jgi:aspartate racemase
MIAFDKPESHDVPSMKRRIGLLGGISHESTAQYYTTLHRKYYERHGNYYFPEVVVFSLDFQRFTDLENGSDREAYIGYIITGLDALVAAGTDGIAMTANSPHSVFDDLAAHCPVPMLSLVEATCRQAVDDGYRDLLLLGIRFTMQSDFYPAVGATHGLRITVPGNDDQAEVDRIVFEELAHGELNDASRDRIRDVVAAHPCDAVILGCTELPLLIGPDDLPVPALDTIDIHTDAILDWAANS